MVVIHKEAFPRSQSEPGQQAAVDLRIRLQELLLKGEDAALHHRPGRDPFAEAVKLRRGVGKDIHLDPHGIQLQSQSVDILLRRQPLIPTLEQLGGGGMQALGQVRLKPSQYRRLRYAPIQRDPVRVTKGLRIEELGVRLVLGQCPAQGSSVKVHEHAAHVKNYIFDHENSPFSYCPGTKSCRGR